MVTLDKTPYYKKLCFNLITISLITYIFYLGQDILVPVFFSVLLASLLLPVNKFLERKGLNRIVANVLSLFFSFVIIGLLVFFLSNQIASFFDDLPGIEERLKSVYVVAQKWVQETFNIELQTQKKYIGENFVKIKSLSEGILKITFFSLAQILSYLLLIPLYTFLLLYYRAMIKRFIIQSFSDSREEKVNEIILETQYVSQSYVAGLMFEMMVVFALNTTGFLILGIKYSVFLALVAALLNLIPYIGMLIATGLCMLVTLISGEAMELSAVLWVGIILIVIQFIDNNFLMPLIVGTKVRVNSLAAIIGVLVGGTLCGVTGMFLSIPGLAVMKVIFDRVNGLKGFGMLIGDESEPKINTDQTKSELPVGD